MKTAKLNAILIDPKTQTVTAFHMNDVNDTEEMRKWIDCDHFELPIIMEDLHADIYCDEEGWYSKEETFAFKFDGIIIPSRALVIGNTDNGDQSELTEETIAKLQTIFAKGIEWLGQVTEDDMPQPQVLTAQELAERNPFFAALFGFNSKN